MNLYFVIEILINRKVASTLKLYFES